MAEDIIIGKKYMSNNYGPFKILKNLGYIDSKNNIYEIQFIWSTCITQSRKNDMLKGIVKDPWNGINPNIIQYSNNYGPFKILNFNYNGTADIQFIYTNNIKYNIQISHIKDGNIKDEYINPLIIKPLDTSLLQPNIKEYRIHWKLNSIYFNIKYRCNNLSSDRYNAYGFKGIKMCNKWMDSFNNFKQDAINLPQYNKFERWPTLYQIDKDYKQQSIPKSQRIYGPETCMFLYYMDNLNLQHIERHTDSTKFLSLYYGVNKINNNYNVELNVYGKTNRFGTYNDEIAAANMYNHLYDYYHKYVYPRHELIPLYNDVPYMSWNECMQYRIPSSRLLYTLTNEPTISMPEFIEKYRMGD